MRKAEQSVGHLVVMMVRRWAHQRAGLMAGKSAVHSVVRTVSMKVDRKGNGLVAQLENDLEKKWAGERVVS